MDILNNTLLKDDKIKKNEVEQVVKEKMEYTLLGTYIIKKGLKLFYYNPVDGSINEAIIKTSDLCICELTEEGWIYYDSESDQTTIDGRCIYFQALRMQSAIDRVAKFKQGKIKELFNLKKPNPDGIDFFKPL